MAELGRSCYQRGWVLGTSGNFSAVITRTPLVLTITASGLHKGTLSAEQFVRVGADGTVLEGQGRPSAETALHLTVVRVRQAGAVVHTHSVWSTLVSGFHGESGGVSIAGYEM